MVTMTTAPAPLAGAAPPARRRRRHARQAWIAWAYAAPAALVLLGMFVIPLGFAVFMSLTDWRLLGGIEGLNFPDNYVEIADDSLFRQAVWFTVRYTAVITVILLLLSFGLALIVQEARTRVTGLLRTAYFLPVVTGITTAALLFLGLLNPTVGPVDDILGVFGVRIDWLGDPDAALAGTVIMMTWRFAGFYMIILLAGLQAIPRELYEAAAVDGAGRLRILRSVTLPLLRSTLSLCGVLIITGGLVAFEQFYVMTGGGPDNSTVTVVMTIFREAFSQFNIGTAAAMSIVVLLGLVVLNAVQLRLVRRDPQEER